MNEKDIINSEELESINSELFGAFDPGDESCIGGGGFTNTEQMTFMDGTADVQLDLDLSEFPDY